MTGRSLNAPTTVVYALFMEIEKVKAVTIDAISGRIVQQVPVVGFNNWGEITRVFMWDGKRSNFYYLEVSLP